MIGLRSLAFSLLSVAAMAVASLAFLPLVLTSRRGGAVVTRRFAAFQLGLLRLVAGLGLELRGLENLPAGPALLAVKHQSTLETYALVCLLPGVCFVLKREIVSLPLVGLYIRALAPIAIDRTGGAGALRAVLRQARAAAGGGRKIAIFPEGTRSAPGERRPYRPGIAALYRELALPVVPVAVNTGLFWPRRRLAKRPGRAVVAFLPPLPPGLPRAAFMTELEGRIEGETARLCESL